MNFVGDVIAERGWDQKTVGVEMDAYYFSARGYAELQKHLPGARFANADLLVNWVRLVKSDAEIALMREAGQIANRVMTTAIERLEPGVRECDAVAAVYQAQMSGTAEFGGDYPAIVPMMPTGEKTSAPHLTWTDAPYENEQMVNLELAACRHRYHCPIARTAYLGKNPPAKLVELAERTVEGLNLTLEAIRPDMRAEAVGVGLAQAHRQIRPGKRIAHRLRHGPQLPAGLGRAHRQPAPRRSNCSETQHDLSHDPGHVDGQLRFRMQRILSRQRERMRNLFLRTPETLRQRVKGMGP